LLAAYMGASHVTPEDSKQQFACPDTGGGASGSGAMSTPISAMTISAVSLPTPGIGISRRT
jgi:hypothetical protein